MKHSISQKKKQSNIHPHSFWYVCRCVSNATGATVLIQSDIGLFSSDRDGRIMSSCGKGEKETTLILPKKNKKRIFNNNKRKTILIS